MDRWNCIKMIEGLAKAAYLSKLMNSLTNMIRMQLDLYYPIISFYIHYINLCAKDVKHRSAVYISVYTMYTLVYNMCIGQGYTCYIPNSV